MGNQGSIPSKSENRPPPKHSSSTRIKTLKPVVKSAMFSKISCNRILVISKFGKQYGSTTTTKMPLLSK